MTIFLLKESKEYDNYYFLEKYATREEAVKHLLECELNRIRYKLDEISECEVENDNK